MSREIRIDLWKKRPVSRQDMEEKPKLKNYCDIIEDLLMEGELTKQEYSELKAKYEYNLQQYS